MNRLKDIEKSLIAKKQQRQPKKQLDFDHFRSLSKIDKQEMKEKYYGPNWMERDKLLEAIRSNQDLFPHYHLIQSSRQQMRKKAAQVIFSVKRLSGFNYQKYMQNPNIITLYSNALAFYSTPIVVKNGVHFFLYAKSIFNLGTEKHKKYLQNAVSYKDIGCFGLTQLLHGSNVKGIMTQAHYDHKTRSFSINSPSKQAMKFWIGAAAELANMSVIWAQLYIDKKCYGVHAFLVPVRDKKTHKLLPGVLIGDCGPKNGNNQIDNGFMLFDNVRIPVDNLLDKISGVDADGKFVSTVSSQQKRFGMHLAALSGGRFMIALNGVVMALSALTIAIRYSCVRRQFSNNPTDSQNLLMEYPLTRRRLMPLLAQTLIYQQGNLETSLIWDRNHLNILNPENKLIQQLHAISSVTKTKSTWLATEVIKECRQMLGGHGYSSLSKLGTLYNDNDVNTTWEGDNNVLYQQATKYILDNAQRLLKGKQIEVQILKFLADPPSEKDVVFQQKNYLDFNWGKKFLQYCLNSKIQDMGMKMLDLKQQKMLNMYMWNNCQVYLGKTIAMIFGDLYYLTNAVQKLQAFKNKQNRQTFKLCINLWFLKVLRESQFVDGIYHASIERLMSKLCDSLANQALGLLQALSTCDLVIGSPFACPEGNGFKKYVQMVRAAGKQNQRPQWWQILTHKQ